MNKTELVKKVADTAGLSLADTKKIVDSFIDLIKQSALREDVFPLPGFGHFLVESRSERHGTNPSTGALMVIPASKTLVFEVDETEGENQSAVMGISNAAGVSETVAIRGFKAIIQVIKDTLSRSEEIKLSGLGRFIKKFRPERPVRDPETGYVITVPSSTSILFKVSPAFKELKELLIETLLP